MSSYDENEETEYPEMKGTEDPSLYRRVIRTLRRIPADIRQELATREFDMGDAVTCLVGTAVRAGLARAQNLATEDIGDSTIDDGDIYKNESTLAAELFGGRADSWGEIFGGVADNRFPVIERAFTNALLETIPA